VTTIRVHCWFRKRPQTSVDKTVPVDLLYFFKFCEKFKEELAATLWWFTATPKCLKIQVFWGSPSPHRSYSPYILGDTTRPGHVTCVLVWSKSDRTRLRKTLHKQTNRQTNRHYENNVHLAVNKLSFVLIFAAQYRVGRLYVALQQCTYYTHGVVRSVNAALDIRPITGLLKFDATVNFD